MSDRLAHELPVIAQAADDGVFLDELEVLLGRRRIPLFDELPQGTEVIGPVALGDLAGLLDLITAVRVGERQQSHQYAATFDAAILQHRLRPLRCVRAASCRN